MSSQPFGSGTPRILARVVLAKMVLAPVVLALALLPGEARARATQAGTTDEAPARVDLLSMGAGAFPIRYDDGTQRTLARALLDGLPGYVSIDRSPTGPEEPLVLVVELAAPTVFREFGVPPMSSFGCCVGTLVARITVEGSLESPDDGYERLAVLEPRADEFQAEKFFPVESERRVRWVRITFEGRQDPDPDDFRGTTLTDLIGLGTQEPRPDVPGEFSGIFLTGGGAGGGAGNRIELIHEGALVTGCRQSGGALSTTSGGVENGILKLTAPDGVPTPCSEPDAGPPNPVAEALDAGRVAIVYGINFDVDSDALRTDAGPALEQILAALEQFPEISITIEGHTDSDGSDAHNLELSQRRAESVAAWLEDRGVAASRLEPVGRGESDPIADNVSDAGKAANRRVELEGR